MARLKAQYETEIKKENDGEVQVLKRPSDT